MGDRLIAKAMDNRIACAIMVQALRDLQATPHDVYFVFTVQEEVGCVARRPRPLASAPDVGIAVDVTLAADIPEGPHLNMVLGNGPCIKVKDGGHARPSGGQEPDDRDGQAAGHPLPDGGAALAGSTDAMAMQLSQPAWRRARSRWRRATCTPRPRPWTIRTCWIASSCSSASSARRSTWDRTHRGDAESAENSKTYRLEGVHPCGCIPSRAAFCVGHL